MELVKVAIVAHEARSENLKALSQLGKVFLDDGSLGEWENHKRAWLWLAEQDCEWGVVLQDDAIPISNFTEVLEAIINNNPINTSIVSLYLGTGYPLLWQPRVRKACLQADSEGASWIVANELLHGVGVAIKNYKVNKGIQDAMKFEIDLPYDQRLGAWARSIDMPVAYTWPSLVDHEDSEPLIDGRPARVYPRKARRVGIPLQNNKFVKIGT